MSLCNIPLLTSSLKKLHGYTSNFVWKFIGWTPTKLNFGCYPIFHGIISNFAQFLANA